MIVESATYSQTHHVNMGSFEWVELSATATVKATAAADHERPEALMERAKEIVENRLRDDLDLARTLTAEDDTYVNHLLDGPRHVVPRRRRRVAPRRLVRRSR
ncbi:MULTISPECIES: hypothetical protein [Streptosporangium]|uniref:Uncharacterized protein n=1 Tax=Streptosporangium brasiliense TaxID=47480 RepID=A0ABT9RNM7_9ACTN|nr:hypothetical protein [Streptosporangium brasiliense]MDP9870441.1 hypothetical protein [Streptosporangium brasiliense]